MHDILIAINNSCIGYIKKNKKYAVKHFQKYRSRKDSD